MVSLASIQGQIMRRPSFAFCCVAVNARAETPPVISTQDVRFTEKTIPNGIVAPPLVLDHPNPAYTNEARRRGIEGNVIVQAQFDADGNVKVLRIVRGLGYGLDENALAALQNWIFAPAVKNGQRVSVIAEIEIPFRMPDLERIRLQVEAQASMSALHEKMMAMKKAAQDSPHLPTPK